jgi:hypothetical protein
VPTQVKAQPIQDEYEVAVGLERVLRVDEGAVKLVNAMAKVPVGNAWVVDRRADEFRAEDGRVEVQDPLAEAVRGGGAAVMWYVRR